MEDEVRLVVPSMLNGLEVKWFLEHLAEKNGYVTRSDVFDLVGEIGNYADDRVGWTTVDEIKLQLVDEGCEIYLPAPIPIA